jgi:serpin B
MKKKLLSILLCAAMLATLPALAGCESKVPPTQPASQSQAQKPAEGAPLPPAEMLSVVTTPDPARREEVSAAALGFAAELLRRTEGDNRLLSPLSVLCALGMVLEGAGGETRSQMEAAFGVSGEALDAFLGPWLSALAAEEGSPLRVADGIWISDRPDLHISEGFLERNRSCYGAAVEQCPFDAAAVDRINEFVKRNTRDMIEKLLDALPPEAVLVLVNALAFEADWETPYREDQVRPGVFHTESGEEQEATFLHSGENVYLKDENTTGFLKYYSGGRYAFAALLPAEGMALADYVASLTGEKLRGLLAGAKETKVETVTPKFETEFSVQLNDALMAMGMTDAFDADLGDFSALGFCDNGDNLYIGQVVHKTYLKLDETGTRAGAATGVTIYAASALREPPPQVVLDRPFVYLLLDTETNIPLFIGTVDSMD